MTALRIFLQTLLITSYTVVLGPPAMLAALVGRSGSWALAVARMWVRMILWTCGVRVVVEGVDQIDRHTPCIVMSNHQSFVDTAVLLHSFPGPLRFMAKRELARIPIFGWSMAMGGHLLVDRGNRRAVKATLDRGVSLVRSGKSLCVFPEGSRSPEGELASFKNGGFQMALEAQVPIQPVRIFGSGVLAPPDTAGIAPGEVVVRYLPRVLTEGCDAKDRPALKNQVRESILAAERPRRRTS